MPGEGIEPSLRAPATASLRVANIDRLRLLALMEIVVFHATGAHMFGASGLPAIGLPIFLLFTVALNARPRPGETTEALVQRKAVMFLVPWAAWCVVYAITQTAAPLVRGGEPFKWFKPTMLLLGTQVHLWYLIFALLASVAAVAGYRVTSRLRDPTVIVGGAILACALLVGEQFVVIRDSWAGDWMVAIPAIPLGLALGRCIHAPTARERVRRTTLLALIVGPVMAVLDQTDLGYSAGRFALAIIPITLVVLWPGRPDAVTTGLTRLRLGVYLVHMLIIGALHFAGAENANQVVRSIVVIVGSFALTWAITLTPLRWMVQPNALKRFAGS
jgi:hypothetical protein